MWKYDIEYNVYNQSQIITLIESIQVNIYTIETEYQQNDTCYIELTIIYEPLHDNTNFTYQMANLVFNYGLGKIYPTTCYTLCNYVRLATLKPVIASRCINQGSASKHQTLI